MLFQIISSAGVDMGIFEGASRDAAILAMYRAAGYGPDVCWLEDGELAIADSYRELLEPSDLKVREIEGFCVHAPADAERISHSELRAAAIEELQRGETPVYEIAAARDGHPEPIKMLHIQGDYTIAARGGGSERFDSREEALDALGVL